MRRKMTLSLLSFAIFLLLAASFCFHVSRDLLPSSTSFSSSSPAIAAINQPIERLTNNAVRELLGSFSLLQPRSSLESVLLPDWEVLVALPPGTSYASDDAPISCLFQTGEVSPARSAGPSAFRCTLPRRIRRFRPFYTPRLLRPSAAAIPQLSGLDDPPREMIRWSSRITYESLSTVDDVVVLAKGINHRKDANVPAESIHCVFEAASGGGAVATTIATSSAQEVFRCPHPAGIDALRTGPMRVSLATGLEEAPIPTVANYEPPPQRKEEAAATVGRSLICACTMVLNVAKFLPEWVTYHSAVGVERFFLYDNGSEDGLDSVVSQLGAEGFSVAIRSWPWPKTQEAGFSHCAVVNRGNCEWMAFIDIDEFILSPVWTEAGRPDRSMLQSLIALPPEVGQVSINCLEFGPSGQREHPAAGVTQGYTCRRRRAERHKSLVRLDAVDHSLINAVHHFRVREGLENRWVSQAQARVNHYKYQAWEEFRNKFRRRVSTYVADWTESANLASKDRTPGLGSDPIEPSDWAEKFCEVNDTLIQDATRRWFGAAGSDGAYKMPWQSY